MPGYVWGRRGREVGERRIRREREGGREVEERAKRKSQRGRARERIRKGGRESKRGEGGG